MRSTLWRLYSKTRAHQIQGWQEAKLHASQHGARPGHSAHGVIAPAAITLEAAATQLGPAVVGLSYDLSKFFDRMDPHQVALIWSRWGMHPATAQLMEHAMRQCHRRFKVCNGALGRSFLPPRGLVQGCASSVAAANAMLAPLCWALQRIADEAGGDVLISSYIDDLFVISTCPTLAARLDAEIRRFVDMTALELNFDKCSTYKAGNFTKEQWAPVKYLHYQHSNCAGDLEDQDRFGHYTLCCYDRPLQEQASCDQRPAQEAPIPSRRL